jgi:hypothetical protein
VRQELFAAGAKESVSPVSSIGERAPADFHRLKKQAKPAGALLAIKETGETDSLSSLQSPD